MPFCGEAAKRHYKGLTIDEILRMVYIRLKLHVDSKIDLATEPGETVHISGEKLSTFGGELSTFEGECVHIAHHTAIWQMLVT